MVATDVRRGPGGRGAGLAPDVIVTTALALMDEHGVEWVTMRRLADELGVAPSAIYWHFANKDELCAAVMAAVSTSLQWDRSPVGSPRARLEAHLLSLRAHWRRHPAFVALGKRVRPAESGEFTQSGMAVLGELGFDAEERERHWLALVWLVLGFFFVEDAVSSSVHHAPVAGAPGRYHTSLGASPRVLDTDALFAHALQLALDGVEAQLPR